MTTTREQISLWLRDADAIPGHKLVAALAVEHDALLLALDACLELMDDPPQVIRSNDTDAYRNGRAAINKARGCRSFLEAAANYAGNHPGALRVKDKIRDAFKS